MPLYRIAAESDYRSPVMVLALSGWVDAASVGTDAAEHLAADGEVVADFDPDELFDYRSNRPILHFRAGQLQEVNWPKLRVMHRPFEEGDVLVVTGSEPDFRWVQLSEELLELARRWGAERLITLGAVPAPVPHTRDVRVVATASSDDLLLDDDEVLPDELIVPGAAVSILREALEQGGIPSLGYWVQVPHYLNRPFHAGVLALVEKLARQLDVALPVGDLSSAAQRQREEIDRMLEKRQDARDYVQRLEGMSEEERPAPSLDDLPSADEIGAEVERFLRRSAGDDD